MSSTSPDLSGVTIGHYRIDALIGAGGMGTVYRAHDTTLGRPVALKILPPHLVVDPDRIRRFVQEARTASSLNHPNVVTIYEVGEAAAEGGRPIAADGPLRFIAMELVEGQTLRELLATRRLELGKTLEYFSQAADGLAAAHARGVIHRDLKPENIMIAESGFAKVLDFGLAKLREPLVSAAADAQTTLESTSPGVILGTVAYMSPEQALGKEADHRSDVFSFGCVLYEAATGRHPFRTDSTVDTLHRVIHTVPSPLSEVMPTVPSELQRIVRKCLAKDPDERYQSIKDVAIDLRELRRQMDSGAAAPAAAPRPAARRLSRWVLPALIVAALAVVSIVVWRSMRPAGTTAGQTAADLEISRLTSTGLVTAAVISPDGKYFAYVVSELGQQNLWVRQVDAVSALQLTPPARVGYWGMTFSPDSTSVYYVVKGQVPDAHPSGVLYQLPLLGGTRRTLLQHIDSPITWSPDGHRFAFTRANYPQLGQSVVMTANADGSDVRPLATRRPPSFFAPIFFATPTWSPDGTTIVTASRLAPGGGSLISIDVATGAEREISPRFPEVNGTAWLPDRSGIVFAAAVPGSLARGGGQLWLLPTGQREPRRITNDVILYRSASVTADSRSIVAVGADNNAALWIAPVGAGEPRKLPSTTSDGIRGLAWMPDGGVIFATFTRGALNIFVADKDGNGRHQLTFDGSNAFPRPSRDGRQIAFVSTRHEREGLWLMDADGSNQREIATAVAAHSPSWTPDGKWIVFSAANEGIEMGWKVPSRGGTPVAFTKTFLARSVVSPDGRSVGAFYRETPQSDITIVVLDFDDGRILRTFPSLGFTDNSTMRWSPSNDALFFSAAERTNVWRQPLAGGTPARVTNFAEGNVFQFEPSADGRSLIMTRGDLMRDAFLIRNFR